MKRTWCVAVVTLLAMTMGVFAQEGGKEGGKRERRGGSEMRGGGHMAGMADIFAVIRTMRALRDIIPQLDEVQKAKFDEAMKKMSEAVKQANTQFEADLANIFTGEQMEKFKAAKEAPPEQGRGRRGSERPERKEAGGDDAVE